MIMYSINTDCIHFESVKTNDSPSPSGVALSQDRRLSPVPWIARINVPSLGIVAGYLFLTLKCLMFMQRELATTTALRDNNSQDFHDRSKKTGRIRASSSPIPGSLRSLRAGPGKR